MTDLQTTGSKPVAPVLARAKAILLTPQTEWPVIAAEPSDPAALFARYAMPLAAIGPVCTFLHGQLFGFGALGIAWRPSLLGGLASLAVGFVLALVGLIVLALIVENLATRFGGVASRPAALKLAVYGATASFLAGVFNLLPGLGLLALLGLYSFYLFYTGATPLMQVPQDKALSFTGVTMLVAVVLALVAGAVLGPVTYLFGGGAGVEATAESGEVTGKVSLPGGGTLDLDRLKDAGERLERAGNNPAKAAVPAAALQALLPASLAGYQRTASEAMAMAGAGSSAEGTYTAGDNSFRLKITDMAALGALAGLGSAMGVEVNRQDGDGYEKTGTVDGHMQSEEWRSGERRGKFMVIVGDRFSIEAEGTAASIDELKAAVAAVDQGKLLQLGS